MMEKRWIDILTTLGGGAADVLAPIITIALIALLATGAYFTLARLIVPIIAKLSSRTRVSWDNIIIKHHVLQRTAALATALLVRALADRWLIPHSVSANIIQLIAQLSLLMTGLMLFYAILEVCVTFYNNLPFARQMPLRGFVQAIKLISILIVLLLAIAMLMGKSPVMLVSGLGAMTAVIMLIFKDAILGFVAGIQLSANRMLAVGDWLEMPKYNADGDVIDITLTTVKVRNWDQTITTIPTYALISDSFKNWRGMQEIGGRRIMRNIFIDMHSIRFISETDIEHLRKAHLISKYIEHKIEEIERHNKEHDNDTSSPVNGRHLTNIGTFRAYILAYLKAHPGIHPDLIMMVRQLQPTSEGLPMQIYAFTRDTAWVNYEGVQSDIFDHLLAVTQEFGLRVFQSPSGSDMRELLKTMPK